MNGELECKLLVEKASAVLSDCMQQHHHYHKIIYSIIKIHVNLQSVMVDGIKEVASLVL